MDSQSFPDLSSRDSSTSTHDAAYLRDSSSQTGAGASKREERREADEGADEGVREMDDDVGSGKEEEEEKSRATNSDHVIGRRRDSERSDRERSDSERSDRERSDGLREAESDDENEDPEKRKIHVKLNFFLDSDEIDKEWEGKWVRTEKNRKQRAKGETGIGQRGHKFPPAIRDDRFWLKDLEEDSEEDSGQDLGQEAGKDLGQDLCQDFAKELEPIAEERRNENQNSVYGVAPMSFGPRVRGRSRGRNRIDSTMSTTTTPTTTTTKTTNRSFNENLREFRDVVRDDDDDDDVDLADFSLPPFSSLLLSSSDEPSPLGFALPADGPRFVARSLVGLFSGLFSGCFGLLAPRLAEGWKAVKEDLDTFPNKWNDVPKSRRIAYSVAAIFFAYYLLSSLYALPLVALGFVAPAWMCRRYVEEEGREEEGEESEGRNNNNLQIEEGERKKVKEMSRWIKFWVVFCGWQLLRDLAPGVVRALLPLHAVTVVVVVAALLVPWTKTERER